MRRFLREGGIATGDLVGGWNDLLADRGHHTVKRAERQAASVCRRKSDSQRKGLRSRRIESACDREDRGGEVESCEAGRTGVARNSRWRFAPTCSHRRGLMALREAYLATVSKDGRILA